MDAKNMKAGFSNWYHNQYLKEDGYVDEPLDPEGVAVQQANAQQQAAQANTQATAPQQSGSCFKKYFSGNGTMKANLASLGKELGDALVAFALKEYVSPDMFDGDDNRINYETAIRDTIAENYNLKIIEILRNAGIFISNTKEKYTK